MRKVVLYTLLSADGVAESPDRFFLAFDEVMDANLGRVIGSQDTVLLGRRTYDEWATYWPTSEIQPFADFINAVRKVVFTSTPPAVGWANASVADGGVDEVVRDLKAQPGGDIGVHGSIALAQSLLAAGLVDELRLVVAPVLAGAGRRLFQEGDLRHLALRQVQGTPSGGLIVDYAVLAPDASGNDAT